LSYGSGSSLQNNPRRAGIQDYRWLGAAHPRQRTGLAADVQRLN